MHSKVDVRLVCLEVSTLPIDKAGESQLSVKYSNQLWELAKSQVRKLFCVQTWLPLLLSSPRRSVRHQSDHIPQYGLIYKASNITLLLHKALHTSEMLLLHQVDQTLQASWALRQGLPAAVAQCWQSSWCFTSPIGTNNTEDKVT